VINISTAIARRDYVSLWSYVCVFTG